MELVAKTYENYEQIGNVFTKNGKNYIQVKSTCDRCGGRGFSSHPSWTYHADNGECFKCFGKGYVIEEVRTYSQKEYDAMLKTAAKAKEKKEELRLAKVDSVNAETKRKLGFEKGYVTIVLGNTFAIKDELKDAGARFNRSFGWHFIGGTFERDANTSFETLDIPWEDVSTQVNEYFLLQTEAEIQKYILDKTFVPSTSEYQGSVGDKAEFFLTIKNVFICDGRFGTSYIHNMEDVDGNVFVWITASKNLPVGNAFKMKGTIKEHKEYKGVKQTILTRCTIMN